MHPKITRLLAFTALACGLVFAQVQSGNIVGTVRDASGAVVPSATVTVMNLGTQAKRTVQSGPAGAYTIAGLQPGQYEVRVSSGNFAPFRQQVEVTVGGSLTVDAALGVSGATTTVEVLAQNPAVDVNTQTQELSQVITSQQLAQLPSLTRNPYDFVMLSGNVTGGDRTGVGNASPNSNGGQNLTDRGVGYSINGQRSSGTEILLDGVENGDLFATGAAQQVPEDSVQEYRIITSNFDAQYGRASGGVVNLTTKAGTNSFHGSAWEFNRISALTARTYDNAAQEFHVEQTGGPFVPKGTYTRNQFGYTAAGPIIKNKLFFFQSTEWVRVRSAASLSALIPTPQLIAFTAPNVQQYFAGAGKNAPAFGSTLTAGQVVASTGDKGAFATTVPVSTPVFGLVNYSAPADAGGGSPQNTKDIVGRLDFNPTDATQMFFRYALFDENDFRGVGFNSPYSDYNVGTADFANSALFSVNHTFSASLLSSSKLSFARERLNNSYDTSFGNIPTLYLDGAPTLANQPVNFPGFYSLTPGAGGLPFGGPQNILQGNEDVSWIKGNHAMRFGGQINYEQINRAYGAFAQATEVLGGNPSQGLDNLITGTLVQYTKAIFPQGKFPCFRDPSTNALVRTPGCTLAPPLSNPSFARSLRYQDWAAYAQDSWKWNPRLTLNYGVRYEYYGVQHNNHQELDSNFYYGSGSNYFQQIANGFVATVPNSPIHSLWKPSYGTVAPRLGFAWDVFGKGTTSLRGGYGISYERNFGNVTFNIIQNPPNSATINLQAGNGVTLPVSLDPLGPVSGSGGAGIALPPSSLRNVDENIRTAQTQFYSLALEHRVGASSLVAVEYSGARGIHLYDIKNINELGSGQAYLGQPLTNGIFTRVNQLFTGINNRGSNGDSYYNGLNVKFQTQNIWKSGLSMVANYTWAHSIDDLSSTFADNLQGASGGIGNLGYLDPRDPGLDRGNSDGDIRHRFVASQIWETPWFRNSGGFWGQALGGYTFTSIFTARTGIPFSVFDSTNSQNAGGGYGWPRYVPAGAISDYATGTANSVGINSFNLLTLPAGNTAVFNPTLGISDFGPYPADMTHRNAFRGPGAWNLDLSASKRFRIREGMDLEFRAEGFNVLNHHNFYVNGANLDVTNFLDASNNPAPIQVVAKKGGLGNLATGGNHDERRFGQLAVRLHF
ncbi:MAG: TonB-dependent receptor domain-containing protein [Terriglobales bacterium]